MRLTQYQIDAFTDRPFDGNPAAVVPLEQWLDDDLMQAIANENNLAETAFFVPEGDGFGLRWFTPTREVDLCGHATLATAHALFEHLDYDQPAIRFGTRSGDLFVERRGGRYAMDFPAQPTEAVQAPEALIAGLGYEPQAAQANVDYLAVLDSEEAVKNLKPNLAEFAQLDRRGVIVTAPGDRVDFVSRFFAPKYGIPEDPVTGSAHCQLTPYWAKQLGKNRLQARQISARGGDLECELKAERVTLSGAAVTVMEARLFL